LPQGWNWGIVKEELMLTPQFEASVAVSPHDYLMLDYQKPANFTPGRYKADYY
jgi:hypothetical protein